jgi:hypothetical protein
VSEPRRRASSPWVARRRAAAAAAVPVARPSQEDVCRLLGTMAGVFAEYSSLAAASDDPTDYLMVLETARGSAREFAVRLGPGQAGADPGFLRVRPSVSAAQRYAGRFQS